MAKVTSNTQIDTINILTEVNSANDTDLILLQRGLVSHKMQKQNLIIPSSQIAPINNNKVLGNVSGSSAAPSEIKILDSNEPDSNSDNELVTEKRVKNYVNTEILNIEGLGINQTWKLSNNNNIGWQTYGDVYTNNTGKPIQLNIFGTASNPNDVARCVIRLTQNGSNLSYIDMNILAVSRGGGAQIVIPNGATYRFKNIGDSTFNFFEVHELS